MYNLKVEPRNTRKEGCTWLSLGFITSCLQIFPFASKKVRGDPYFSLFEPPKFTEKEKSGWEKMKREGRLGENKKFSCCLSIF